ILPQAEKLSHQIIGLDSYREPAVDAEVHAASASQSEFERILGNSEIAPASIDAADLNMHEWHYSIPSPVREYRPVSQRNRGHIQTRFRALERVELESSTEPGVHILRECYSSSIQTKA